MTISFARHQFPPAIIRHTVWLYLRFTLSYRDVEDLLAERGLDVSYESVRRVAAPLLEARVADRPNWTLTRLIGEIEAREGVTISKSRLSKVLRKKIPLASTATHADGPPRRRRHRPRRPQAGAAQGAS